jgi:parvulin-like peptidyl-prolyl isomerase
MANRVKQPRHPNRRHISRLEKENRQRRQLYIGTGAVFALILALLAWALIDNYVLKPARPVARVGQDAIRTDEYQKLLQYRRYDSQMYLQTLDQQKQQFASAEGQEFLVEYIDQQIQQIQQSYSVLPTTVLDQMIRDLVVRQEAATRGITVSEDEVQTLLQQQFGYDPDAVAAAQTAATLEAQATATPVVTATATAVPTVTPTVTATVAVEATEAVTTTGEITATSAITATPVITQTPTPAPTEVPMTADEFAESTARFLSTIQEQVGFTEADFRRLLESSLYQDKVEAALKAEMATTAAQVHARHILVATAEEAQKVLDRLAAGEAFDALAKELSTDTGSGAQGGDLGWFGRGQMVTEFDEAAFSLEPGTISEAIATTYGFHIIEVLERDDNRVLEGEALSTYQETQLQTWYTERTTGENVVRNWSADLVPADPFAAG